MSSEKNSFWKIKYGMPAAMLLAAEWVLSLTEAAAGIWNPAVLAGGIGAFLNRVLAHAEDYFPVVHPVFEEEGGTALLVLLILAALALIGLVFFAALCRSRNWFALAAGTMALVPLTIQLLMPEGSNLMLLVYLTTAALLWILFSAGLHPSKSLVLTAAAFLAVAVIFAGAGIGELEERPKIRKAEDASINSGMTFGDFTLLDGKNTEDTKVLTLTMTQPQGYYLKGYTGQEYTGAGWYGFDEIPEEANGLFYWLDKEGFGPENMLAKAAELTGYVLDTSEDSNIITVVNTSGSRKLFYLPYETGLLEGNSQRILDGSLKAAGDNGSSRYTVTAKPYLLHQYRSIAAALAAAGDSEPVQKYLKLESSYRIFVQRYYLEIPEETEEALAEVFTKSVKMGDVEAAKAAILSALNEFEYNEKITYTDQQGDFVSAFLEKKAGYSHQFASAAAMAFRYYGIPARFAEGYLVTEEMTEGIGEGQPIEVTAANAHSWVEYYQDGVGWIPFEVTPPYIGLMKSGESFGHAGQTEDEPDQKPLPPQPPEEEQEKQVTSEAEVNYLSLFILLVLLAALAAWIIWYILKRGNRKGYRKKDFRQPDRKKAMMALMKYIRHLEEKKGLPAELAEKRSRIQQIYEEARYSSHQADEEKYREMMDFAGELKKRKKERKR